MSQLAPAVSSDLKQLASDVLTKALKAGATDAEAVIYEGDEFSALVHLGQVETLKESGSRAVGMDSCARKRVSKLASTILVSAGRMSMPMTPARSPLKWRNAGFRPRGAAP